MFQHFLALLFKSNCSLCQRATSETICQACQAQIYSCQNPLPAQLWQGETPIFIWGYYQQQLKQALAALKYNGAEAVGETLGYWLAIAWLDHSHLAHSQFTVVPIPLDQHKLTQRGYNQAELLARAFCHLTRYRLEPHGLIRVKSTQAMYNLNFQQRKSNLEGAFAVGQSLQQRQPKHPILLLDDIYTTGTTIRQAALTLRQKGIDVAGAVAVATPKFNRV